MGPQNFQPSQITSFLFSERLFQGNKEENRGKLSNLKVTTCAHMSLLPPKGDKLSDKQKKMYPCGHIRRKGLWDLVENLVVYNHNAPWRSHCGYPQSVDVTVPNIPHTARWLDTESTPPTMGKHGFQK